MIKEEMQINKTKVSFLVKTTKTFPTLEEKERIEFLKWKFNDIPSGIEIYNPSFVNLNEKELLISMNMIFYFLTMIH